MEEKRKQVCLEIEECKKKQRLEKDASMLFATADKLCEAAELKDTQVGESVEMMCLLYYVICLK